MVFGFRGGPAVPAPVDAHARPDAVVRRTRVRLACRSARRSPSSGTGRGRLGSSSTPNRSGSPEAIRSGRGALRPSTLVRGARSLTVAQPPGQAPREAGRQDGCLDRGDVVCDAMPRGVTGGRVEDHVAGIGASVARLPDAARIQDQCGGRPAPAGSPGRRPVLSMRATAFAKDQWDMGMADQAVARLENGQALPGRRLRVQVFPDRIARTAMRQGEVRTVAASAPPANRPGTSASPRRCGRASTPRLFGRRG